VSGWNQPARPNRLWSAKPYPASKKNAAERASLLGSTHKTRGRLAAGKPRKGDLIPEACRLICLSPHGGIWSNAWKSTFPDEENQNPNEEMTFPDEEKQNPRVEIAIPDQEKQNATRRWSIEDSSEVPQIWRLRSALHSVNFLGDGTIFWGDGTAILTPVGRFWRWR